MVQRTEAGTLVSPGRCHRANAARRGSGGAFRGSSAQLVAAMRKLVRIRNDESCHEPFGALCS